MPNCKYDGPGLYDARHINDLETMAKIARTLSRKTKQEEILLEVTHRLELCELGHFRANGPL